MKDILHDANMGVLAEFARSNTLLAFDFDGTLAPIVTERDDARMRSSTAKLLAVACAAFPTAIISGRARSDVMGRLADSRVKYVVGNHGLEPWSNMRWFAREAALMRSEITMRLLPHAEIEIEDKLYSLAIHYRKASAKRETRARILRACAKLHSKPRIVLGKCVVNLLPVDGPDKGTALEHLRAQEGAKTAIYIGDDVTDEDAFELAASGRVLAVRVGWERASAAPYFLRDQTEVDVLLERLVTLRSACKSG